VLTLGWRLLLSSPFDPLVVVDRVLDDAPERSGSDNRHDDVRELESQLSHTQVVASEYGRP
jgi:hypothetical protein